MKKKKLCFEKMSLVQSMLPAALLQYIDEQFVSDCESAGLTRLPCAHNQVQVSNLNILSAPTERNPVCCRPANNFASYIRAVDRDNLSLSRSILRSITPQERSAANINHQLIATTGTGGDSRRFHVAKALLENFAGPALYAGLSWTAALRRPRILQQLLQTAAPGTPNKRHFYETHVLRLAHGQSADDPPLADRPPQFWKRVATTMKPVVEIGPTSGLAEALRRLPDTWEQIYYDPTGVPAVPGVCVRVDGALYEHAPYAALNLLAESGALSRIDAAGSDRLLELFMARDGNTGGFGYDDAHCDLRIVHDIASTDHDARAGMRSHPYVQALLSGRDAVARVILPFVRTPVRVDSLFICIDNDSPAEDAVRDAALHRLLELTPRPQLSNDDVVILVGLCTKTVAKQRMFSRVLHACPLAAATAADKFWREACVSRVVSEVARLNEERFLRAMPLLAELAAELGIKRVQPLNPHPRYSRADWPIAVLTPSTIRSSSRRP